MSIFHIKVFKMYRSGKMVIQADRLLQGAFATLTGDSWVSE